MGTRTAIFQQQENGQYKGIYIHYDGYIEGVGAMLHLAYQDRAKVKRLIDQEKPLANLGATGETVVITDYNDPRRSEKIQIKETMKDVFRYTLVHENQTLELLADDEEDITDQTYQVRDQDGQILRDIEDIEYYYYQEVDDEWYVAIKEADGFNIQPLSHQFNK